MVLIKFARDPGGNLGYEDINYWFGFDRSKTLV